MAERLLKRPNSAPAARSAGRSGPLLFAAGLVLALVAGFAIGKATGGGSGATPPAPSAAAIPSHAHGGPGATVGNEVGGLSASAGGYLFAPTATTFAVGVAQPFTFRILGPDRKPVTSFAVAHDKKLHLVVARRDLSGFQHLHPDMAPDGTWSVPLTLPASGIWRAYADFVATDTAGQQVPAKLAADLTVPGDYKPVPLPAAAREATVGGYTVTYEGTPQVGGTQPLSVRVFAGGAPVTTLERYLGAYGHLVVLREADQGYLHVHPEDQLVGGAVKFWVAAPSPGRYRAFFEFQASGTVHKSEFTIEVP